jgi:hypothetical protein
VNVAHRRAGGAAPPVGRAPTIILFLGHLVSGQRRGKEEEMSARISGDVFASGFDASRIVHDHPSQMNSA